MRFEHRLGQGAARAQNLDSDQLPVAVEVKIEIYRIAVPLEEERLGVAYPTPLDLA